MTTDTIRDIRQQPFYWIDRHFLTEYASRIGPLGIAVYNALVYRSDRTGRAFPGLVDLSNLTGIKSKTTLRRVLASLVKENLIKVNTRFDGQRYETNEYFILPVGQEMTQVGQEMTHPGTSNDLGGSANDPPLVQEMTHPRSGNDTDLQSSNNNHDNNNHLTTSNNNSMSALPAAAVSLLESFSVNIEKLNGQALDMAAWVVYAMTQKGLKNPIGYAMTRAKNHEKPAPAFSEIVAIEELTWQEMLKSAPFEKRYRIIPQDDCVKYLWQEMEPMSNEAIDILAEIAEAVHERKR